MQLGCCWTSGKEKKGQQAWAAATCCGLCSAWQLVLHTRPDFGPAKKMENGPYLGPHNKKWASMGLVSKEWAWVEGNGLGRCKRAE